MKSDIFLSGYIGKYDEWSRYKWKSSSFYVLKKTHAPLHRLHLKSELVSGSGFTETGFASLLDDNGVAYSKDLTQVSKVFVCSTPKTTVSCKQPLGSYGHFQTCLL